jgi:hypothetical protein
VPDIVPTRYRGEMGVESPVIFGFWARRIGLHINMRCFPTLSMLLVGINVAFKSIQGLFRGQK